MKASKETIKENDKIIFFCDEYNCGDKQDFDGSVQRVRDDGVDVIYLSGYKSRNDFIPFGDIVAKVDLSMPVISLKDASFKGHFIEFER